MNHDEPWWTMMNHDEPWWTDGFWWSHRRTWRSLVLRPCGQRSAPALWEAPTWWSRRSSWVTVWPSNMARPDVAGPDALRDLLWGFQKFRDLKDLFTAWQLRWEWMRTMKCFLFGVFPSSLRSNVVWLCVLREWIAGIQGPNAKLDVGTVGTVRTWEEQPSACQCGGDCSSLAWMWRWYLLNLIDICCTLHCPKWKLLKLTPSLPGLSRYIPVWRMTMDPRMARKLARHRLWSISERSLSCNFAQTEAVRMSQVLCGYPCVTYCVTMWHYVLLHFSSLTSLAWNTSIIENIHCVCRGLYRSLQSWRGEAEEAHQLGPEATWYRWQMAPHGAAFSLMRYFADLDIPIKRGTFIEFRQARPNHVKFIQILSIPAIAKCTCMICHETATKLEWCDMVMWCDLTRACWTCLLLAATAAEKSVNASETLLSTTSKMPQASLGHPTMTLTFPITSFDLIWFQFVFTVDCGGLRSFQVASCNFPCLGNDFEKFDLANGIRQVRRWTADLHRSSDIIPPRIARSWADHGGKDAEGVCRLRLELLHRQSLTSTRQSAAIGIWQSLSCDVTACPWPTCHDMSISLEVGKSLLTCFRYSAHWLLNFLANRVRSSPAVKYGQYWDGVKDG